MVNDAIPDSCRPGHLYFCLGKLLYESSGRPREPDVATVGLEDGVSEHDFQFTQSSTYCEWGHFQFIGNSRQSSDTLESAQHFQLIITEHGHPPGRSPRVQNEPGKISGEFRLFFGKQLYM
ncbi:hypothetical protein ACWEBX_36615 [Streptomyces sp. NPDC005070]